MKYTRSYIRTKRKQAQRGFTLLLAVLISSILLALGSAIFNIVSKEIILSSSGRESQFAFYAADTGIECALYWDGLQKLATSTASSNIACGGAAVQSFQNIFDAPTGTWTTTFFFFMGPTAANPCATVTVAKRYGPASTVISSQGYNTCVDTNPVRLERAIRVQY